jgi:imipenem/basic amino acid-specific outer membrane pore
MSTALMMVGTLAYGGSFDQSNSNGFVDDAHLTILEKNYYFYRNYLNQTGNRNYIDEWANGVLGDFTSGFTQGTVGFGVDAQTYWGLKLDSAPDRAGADLLPLGSDGRTDDEFSKVNGAVKLRVSKTVLKYGYLQPTNQIFNYSDNRIFPQSFEGFQLLSQDIKNFSLDAGYFTSGSSRTDRDHHTPLGNGYGNVAADSATYAGGTYTFSKNLNVAFYASNLEDIWNQYYVNVTHTAPFRSNLALTSTFDLYRTLSEGQENSGSINNTTWSLAEALAMGVHKFTLAVQKVDGDDFFDHQGTQGQYGRMWIANSVMIYDFNAPNEKSVQARYDYDFAALGLPGLSLMARYVKGFDVDGTHANAHYSNSFGSDGKEWERDIDLRYVVQSGSLQNLSTWLRYGAHRGTQGFSDMNELRVIVQYPINVF